MTGTGSEAFRSRGPRSGSRPSVLDLTPEDRAARKRLYGFGDGAYRRQTKPYTQLLDEAIARAKAGGKCQYVLDLTKDGFQRHPRGVPLSAEPFAIWMAE